LHVKVCLKDLIFIQRVNTDIANSARPQRLIRPPSIAVAKVEYDRVAQSVAGLDNHSFDVHPAIEEVGVNKVWIERKWRCVLPEGLELPIMLGFGLPDARPTLERVGL